MERCISAVRSKYTWPARSAYGNIDMIETLRWFRLCSCWNTLAKGNAIFVYVQRLFGNFRREINTINILKVFKNFLASLSFWSIGSRFEVNEFSTTMLFEMFLLMAFSLLHQSKPDAPEQSIFKCFLVQRKSSFTSLNCKRFQRKE